MLLPIKPIDFELTAPAADLAVDARYRSARVLVRWHAVPVGTVHVSVVNHIVRASDVIEAANRQLGYAIGPEFVARILQLGGAEIPLRPDLRHTLPPPPRFPLPTISLVICTRDRPDDLAVCLAAVARLAPAPIEVIVVDNAPATEATAALVRERYSEFRYVREPKPGLDHARNRGIREARGEIVAFTDDDVIVDSSWIGALTNAFAADPAVGLITGLIEPYELETEAQVLFEQYGGFGRGYQRQYLQASPGARLPWNLIGAGQLGAGANMAMRRELFEQIGLFDPALDVGTPTRGGGDHEIFHRLIKSGCTCLYEPAALVRHRHRRTLGELRRLLYDYGHATRCYFERVMLNFPEDAAGVRQLTRWWWWHWGAKRWLHAWSHPGGFPPELVIAEIKGFIQGRGAYRRARKQILPNEAERPDTFRPPVRAALAAHANAKTTEHVFLDLREPLSDVLEGRHAAEVEIAARFGPHAIGAVRVPSMGRAVSVRRLADEIARSHWPRLLRPWDGNYACAWAAIHADLKAMLTPDSPEPLRLDPNVAVTVVVCTCDRPDDLRRCLRSLVTLNTARAVQLVVVDNRPTSGLTARAVSEFPGVELVPEHRPGSSYARNAGIAAARGEIVVMTDDDMEVAPDWLERIVAPFARADVLAVTGNTLPARVETEAEKHFETYGGFGRGFEPKEFSPHWFHRFRRRAVPTWHIGGSGNAAFRRQIFADPEIGMFDERLGSGVPTGVGEDTKLFYDILRAGSTIVYEPAAVAWHHHRVTMPQLRRQLYGYSKGHVAYHLVTWLENGDKRALLRVAIELPSSLVQRTWRSLTGQYRYPLRLLLTEIAGTLAGPWSLWQAQRHVRRHGPGARISSGMLRPSSSPPPVGGPAEPFRRSGSSAERPRLAGDGSRAPTGAANVSVVSSWATTESRKS